MKTIPGNLLLDARQGRTLADMPTVEQAQSWYDPGDRFHGYDHGMRVRRIAERLAGSEGGDLEIVFTTTFFGRLAVEKQGRI